MRGLKRFLAGAHSKISIVFQSSRTVSDYNIWVKGDPVTVTAIVNFLNTGVFSVSASANVTISPAIGANEWLSGGTPGDWEIRLTKTAGDSFTSGPALSTWHNLGTSRSWTMSLTSTAGTLSGTYTVEFGLAGTSTALFTYTGLVVTVLI